MAQCLAEFRCEDLADNGSYRIPRDIVHIGQVPTFTLFQNPVGNRGRDMPLFRFLQPAIGLLTAHGINDSTCHLEWIV